MVNVLGEGGMNERTNENNKSVSNIMRMLHKGYNLQNWQENEELKQP